MACVAFLWCFAIVKIVPDVSQSFRNRCFLFFFGRSLTLGSMFDKLLQGSVGQGFDTIYRLGLSMVEWVKPKDRSSRAEFFRVFLVFKGPGRFTKAVDVLLWVWPLLSLAEVHCFLSSRCWAFHLPSFRRVFKDRNHCWRVPPRNPVPPTGLAFGQRRRVKKKQQGLM